MALDQVLDTGTAYGRPKGFHNARLTEVGAGTPMGELMRRYWHPVGLATDATDLPRAIRAFGEDLVLFRDKNGRPGLVEPRCCHRGASLLYGRVEEEGIRCCYHGWLFDAQGQCLDQPGEPGGGEHRSKLRQPWYPVEERYGLIWAYMGPAEKKPLLPRYNVFEELDPGDKIFADDSNIGIGGPDPDAPCNWLQHYENIHDPAHFFWLHYLHSGPQFGDRFGEMDLAAIRANLPELTAAPQYDVNERGLAARRTSVLPDGRQLTNIVETALPTMRVVPNPFGKAGRVDHIGFVLPVDDTHIRIYTVLRAPDRSFFDFFSKMREKLASEGRSMEQKQRFPGDYEVQTSQGPISLHSEEHMARSDRAIVMLRRLFEAQLKAVEEGRDPIGVYFKPGSEYVRFEGGSFFAERAVA